MTAGLALIAQDVVDSRKGRCVSLVLLGKGAIGRDGVNSGHRQHLVGRERAGECTSSVQAIVRSSPARARGHELCGRISRQAHANSATQEFDAARVVTLLRYGKRLEPAVW